MTERTLHDNRYYQISLWEKIILFSMRLTILPYYALCYKLHRFIPTDLSSGADVFQKYIPQYELPLVMKWLNLEGNDAITAIKALTFFHTLTGVSGAITEMTPERAVRVETACPAAKYVDQDFCQNTQSCPSFSAVAQAINPDLAHICDAWLKELVEQQQFLSRQDMVANMLETSWSRLEKQKTWGLWYKNMPWGSPLSSVGGAKHLKMHTLARYKKLGGGAALTGVVKDQAKRRKVDFFFPN